MYCVFVCADNVYGVLPKNGWMVASIIIMLIHQIVAYALCESPPWQPVCSVTLSGLRNQQGTLRLFDPVYET